MVHELISAQLGLHSSNRSVRDTSSSSSSNRHHSACRLHRPPAGISSLLVARLHGMTAPHRTAHQVKAKPMELTVGLHTMVHCNIKGKMPSCQGRCVCRSGARSHFTAGPSVLVLQLLLINMTLTTPSLLWTWTCKFCLFGQRPENCAYCVT